jgi:hypothetical protein
MLRKSIRFGMIAGNHSRAPGSGKIGKLVNRWEPGK